jgi:hypothetical protein
MKRNYCLKYVFWGFCFLSFLSCEDSGQENNEDHKEEKVRRTETLARSQRAVSGKSENGVQDTEINDYEAKLIIEEIARQVLSPEAGEDEFLGWLRANGISNLSDIVKSLSKTGQPGAVSPSEKSFCRALATFYSESEDLRLGELLDEIAYPGVYRGQLVSEFSSNLVTNLEDPNKGVLDLLVNGAPESVHAMHYLKIITDAGKYGDPKKILSNIPNPNDGKIGTTVVAKLAPLMLRQTPNSAVKYFTELEPSPLKDAATFFIVKYAADMGDFPAAREWVGNSSNEATKIGAAKYIDRLEKINSGDKPDK